MTSYSSLTAEYAAADAMRRAAAGPRTMNLARMLQMAAFPEKSDWLADFSPAPVYLCQATTLRGSSNLGFSVKLALEDK